MSLDFIAGCLGGMAGVAVGHPLDTVKVHLQSQNVKNPKYTGTLHCLRSLIAKNGIRGIYRGVSSPLMGVAGINAIVFGVYGNALRNMNDTSSLVAQGLAGGVAGFFQSIICSPMELAKSRLQVADTGGQGPIQCLRQIYANDGVRGVFKGFGLTVGREVPSFAAYFMTYELLTQTEDGAPVSTAAMLFAGGCAGVMSWTLTYPVDVIKTRMQLDGVTANQYANSYDCLKQSLKSGGVTSLFRGLAPTLVRAFPVNAVTFTVVTWAMRIFDGEGLADTVRETESMLGKYADVVCTLNSLDGYPL